MRFLLNFVRGRADAPRTSSVTLMNYSANLLPFELPAAPEFSLTRPAVGPMRLADVIPFRSPTLPTPRQLAVELPFFILAPASLPMPRGVA